MANREAIRWQIGKQQGGKWESNKIANREATSWKIGKQQDGK